MRHFAKLFIDAANSRALRIVAAVVVVFCLMTAEAYACPTCKDGLAESDPQQRAMAAGYYYSILFMMSMPFLLVATLGGFAYRAIRKADQRSLAEQSGVAGSAQPTA